MVTGRPRKELNFPDFEKLCAIFCTEEEIAHFFDMSIETLNDRCKENYGVTFLECFQKFSADGKMSLRRKQYELANKGSERMLIWLGKQYLGQKDKSELSGPGNMPLMPPQIIFEDAPTPKTSQPPEEPTKPATSDAQ